MIIFIDQFIYSVIYYSISCSFDVCEEGSFYFLFCGTTIIMLRLCLPSLIYNFILVKPTLHEFEGLSAGCHCTAIFPLLENSNSIAWHFDFLLLLLLNICCYFFFVDCD